MWTSLADSSNEHPTRIGLSYCHIQQRPGNGERLGRLVPVDVFFDCETARHTANRTPLFFLLSLQHCE